MKLVERNVLYVHDGPRWVNTSGEYYGFKTDIKIRDRYYYLGQKISYLMRVNKMPMNIDKKLVNLSNNEIRIIPVPAFNRPKIFYNYLKAKKIIEQCLKNYDVIIVRLPSTIGAIALKCALKINKPIIVEVVACPWDALWNYSLLGKLYAPLSFLKHRELIKISPFVMYVTTKFLQNRYPSKGASIGISDVMLTSTSDELLDIKTKRLLSLSRNMQIILCTIAAVDVPYKGQILVLKAIQFLKKQGYKLQYLIIGGGNNENLKRVAKKLDLENEVIFLGMIHHDDVFSYLDKSDIYIQPSFTEGLPRAVVEAMSRACPCIGTRVGGIPELLENECLFSKGNAKELINILHHFIENNELLVEQAKRNFIYSKSFETSALNKKRNNFYTQFLNYYFNI